MPIYEYRCKDCEKVIEVLIGINDKQPRKCRDCSGSLEKLVSRTSFMLKGGGWFNEGYGSGGGGGSSAPGSKSKSESKSTPKSSSKPKKAAKAAGGKND